MSEVWPFIVIILIWIVLVHFERKRAREQIEKLTAENAQLTATNRRMIDFLSPLPGILGAVSDMATRQNLLIAMLQEATDTQLPAIPQLPEVPEVPEPLIPLGYYSFLSATNAPLRPTETPVPPGTPNPEGVVVPQPTRRRNIKI